MLLHRMSLVSRRDPCKKERRLFQGLVLPEIWHRLTETPGKIFRRVTSLRSAWSLDHPLSRRTTKLASHFCFQLEASWKDRTALRRGLPVPSRLSILPGSDQNGIPCSRSNLPDTIF